ncbi:uncharacterized protein BYT42DRAFT_150919 [Radiomyces spectabilis]|uniref:uncharacterized protein n=1 Tax=Radiomyces spectabilis TaxID=64574 RepID=UPI00221E4404|nr:uncharacterized protein BYT42DRAFT_150919 [Radiomyces spectabilis]KAI8366023.1 hypothetical protein BYT42DRAFT_150919 [Radiomyces spectabilis]
MADTTGHLYVYGDSYSDIRDGNQKSNGPLWSERLADRWGLQLKSLAEQGARACPSSATSVVSSSFSSLADQVQQRTTSSASQDVHAIFIGVTDVVNTKEKLEAEALRDCVKQQIFNIQQTDANARILLFGLPPLEFSPYYAKEPSKIKGRIMEYNAALEDMVNDWDSVNGATASLSYVDLSTLFGAVLGDPSEYRLLDVENAYWDKCQGRCNDPVNNYLWWDAIHITGGKPFFSAIHHSRVQCTYYED